MPLARVVLKPGREKSVQRFHLWIFSGAVKSIEGKPQEGDIVEVYGSDGRYLATGHFQRGSIMVRIFSFEPTDAGLEFWREKFRRALQLRRTLGLIGNATTNAFRLIHGEGDMMPGLIVDVYHQVAVIQAHSAGMYRHREWFAQILSELEGLEIQTVYDKSATTLNTAKNQQESPFLRGQAAVVNVLENGHQFMVDVVEGQKTGFYLDQRDNRQLLADFCAGKRVANLFCYTGGFTVYALKGGAESVDSVDSSEKAIELAKENVRLNSFDLDRCRFTIGDVFDFIKTLSGEPVYDVVICDPPAFAKHLNARDNALKAYRRLNEAIIRLIRPGGLLFTFSCSQVITAEQFRAAVFSAAAATGRPARIIYQLTQAPDHPVNLFHPESEYLKGLVIAIG